jgi:hypothetical protein
MMDSSEISKLIAIATARDGREPSRSDFVSWSDASLRARWTYDEAREAILDFYAETPGKYIQPGDITLRIRTRRRREVNPPVRETLAIAGPGADESRRIATLTEIREMLRRKSRAMDEGPEDPTDDGGSCLDVACPWCHAPVGVRCETRGRPMRRRACHPSRAERAAEVLA